MDKRLPVSEERFKAEATDILCVSHLRWSFVFQRPQHLLTRAAEDRRVFYVEEPIWSDAECRMDVREVAGGVVVAVPHLQHGTGPDDAAAIQRRLLDELIQSYDIRHLVLWYYTPMALGFTRHLAPEAVVFDVMDELSLFRFAPPDLLDREEELFRLSDVVFAGGASLYESKRLRHPNTHLFPSSVDASHFAAARDQLAEPLDQASIPHPRLGFFGVIDERMDLELVAAVADARADWQIILLGPVAKIDPNDLPRRANIHYLGGKEYAELPAYAAGWDLALMPWARNEATQYISPTKTPEYLAAGLQVVSTPIEDVVSGYAGRGLVRLAASPAEFVEQIDAALHESAAERAAWLLRADTFLASNSWDLTWKAMWALVEAGLGAGDSSELERVIRVTQETRPMFDYLVVGAGFAGSVLAERLASDGRKVLIIDRRNHIGGNAYDRHNEDGILIHPYGPHIFHTNSREVFAYLSRFTDWLPYQHRVLASVDGQLLPIPINLNTINQLYGLNLSSFQLEEFFANAAEPCATIRNSEDVVVSKVGRELYEKFFRGYTRKQWNIDPSELEASVTARVPTRTNRDDRYFTDTYQAMPRHGYTRMFEKLLAHPNIKVMLNTDYHEIEGMIPYREMVYTGPIDEFFDFRFGKLPYRSLEFRHETINRPVFQEAPVINYPNDHLYTRVTEFKYLTGQEHPKTSVVYEYPKDSGDPYYPVPRPENMELYRRYKELADATAGVHFVGRLATYKYYNMDQVVAQALTTHARIVGTKTSNGNGKYAQREAATI